MTSVWLADAAATAAFGARLAPVLAVGDVVALTGGLGAGKTSLARGLLAALGVFGEVPSPSFAIVQPYDPPEVRLPVLHVDLYRIDEEREIEELGLAEAQRDGALIVEWPERAAGRWSDALALTLTPEWDGRRLTAMVPPAWKRRWMTL